MPPSRLRRSLTSTAAVTGLVVAPLAVVASTSTTAHAAPVPITLLNINDFHGRIDSNTTKFATTIEQIRASQGEANTLFLSAGDNIGASLFASSSQQDNPTIDVLDALDLRGSAVGNHEFDQGYDDLRGRVQDRADFDLLGANVYQKGTTTPALPEYATYDVNGVTVGVVGVVTQETPSLVSPGGVATLDFGDPVAAVNRVAAQLDDGDPANGEADVVVAEYHEGAPDDAGSQSGVFNRIVTETSAAVDVIFTGHTHKRYALSLPKPGGGTRPVVQTGSYGEYVGRVDLSVDGDVVTTTAQSNVERVAAEDLSLPRVAEVKTITDAAIAEAAKVGNQPVGRVTADITRADSDPATAGVQEDRGDESTLGDLVGNALRDGLPAHLGKADIGITNPGGLRADLLFAGDTSSNPANTDGVVTFGEANAVLPFANNISLVSLTGAQLTKVLEQQWQPAGASRPFLHLGVSDNVEVLLDPSAPQGARVSEVTIDDKPLDPAKTYTVSTPTFLAGGGDNFTAFNEGKAKDTGLLDRDLWVGYLKGRDNVAPDWTRQQVFATGLADSYRAGEKASVRFEKLGIPSLGAPPLTKLELVKVNKDDSRKVFGSAAIVNRTAAPKFTVRGGKSVEFVEQESKATVTREVVRTTPKMVVKVFPKRKRFLVRRTQVRMKVVVKPDVDVRAKGRVVVRVAGRKLNRKLERTKSDTGKVKLKLPRFKRPGRYQMVVKYKGNATFKGSREVIRVIVVRPGRR